MPPFPAPAIILPPTPIADDTFVDGRGVTWKFTGTVWQPEITFETVPETSSAVYPTFVGYGAWSVSGFSGSITPGYPAGIENGDLLVYGIGRGDSATAGPGAGWTSITGDWYGGSGLGGRKVQAWYRFHDGTFPSTTASGANSAGYLAAFRGVDSGDPFGGVGGKPEESATFSDLALSADTLSSSVYFFAHRRDDLGGGSVTLGGTNIDDDMDPNGELVQATTAGGDRTMLSKIGRPNSTGALDATLNYSLGGDIVALAIPINAA